MPQTLKLLGRAVGFEEARLPAAIIAFVRQPLREPQPIQDFSVAGARVEKDRREPPQLLVSRVAIDELLRAVEDRHRDRQLVQSPRVRIFLLLEFRAQVENFLTIEGDRRRAFEKGRLDHEEAPPLAADDGGDLVTPERALRARLRSGQSRRLIEELRLSFQPVLGVPRLDGLQIGVVDEQETAGAVAQPDRGRQGLEQREQALAIGFDFRVALAQAVELEPFARDFAKPQHGASADGASIGVVTPAGNARQRQMKSLSALAQPLEVALQRLGGGRREPGVKSEEALRG